MNVPSARSDKLLRVAFTEARNTQQALADGRNCATTRATTTQHKSLKALAFLALARNGARNNRATLAKNDDAPSLEAATSAILDAEALRLRLHELASAESIPDALVYGALDGDLAELGSANDEHLRAYLRMLRDSALRELGQRPEDETAPILCRRCGPVYAAPEVAIVLPVVAGMPTAAGCGWCGQRGRGLPIPRPPVTCGACRHFVPDRVNPAGGLGECGAGIARGKLPYPFATHTCAMWRPRPDANSRRPQETR